MLDRPAYSASADWVLDTLQVTAAAGLSEAEAAARLARHGPNAIAGAEGRTTLAILLDQFRGAIVWLLIGAALLSGAMGDIAEAVAIVAVLAVNALIGFAMELRAAKSMQALRALARTTAQIRREGRIRRIDAADLVPGDMVLLEAGDLVSADLRLVEATDLQTDESALTGESAPVAKSTAPLGGSPALADRANMAFRGASVARGFGLGVVVRTGRATELGQIADLVAGTDDGTSPLDVKLGELGRQLARATLAIAVLIALIGIAAGRDPMEMLRTGVALAVAAAPEGLPIVATLALARGMWRMAQRNALVNRLASIETLGSTTLIMTDKTGTLTENRMRLVGLILPGGAAGPRAVDIRADPALAPTLTPTLTPALRIAALCAEPSSEGGFTDPMEAALVEGAAAAGLDRAAALEALPLVAIRPFDSELKLMATLHRGPEGVVAAVKGAPERVLQRARRVAGPEGPVPMTGPTRAALLGAIEAQAAEGRRLLGLATATPGDAAADPFDDLVLEGFACLLDPPRADVAEAIATCRGAGVRVVMVTGDHPATARRIAADVGLVDSPDAPACLIEAGRAVPVPPATSTEGAAVYARVAPRDKLDLVARFQRDGGIVAMIGDGVNDAPALKKADIGVAMGQRGTQVAAEASDIVLRDDAFSSIAAALRQGRVIYDNIRLFVRYLLSCNLSEIVVVAGALVLGLPMPLLPLQLLYLNLITDVFPALALGVGPGAADLMARPPRPPGEPMIGGRAWRSVALDAVTIAAGTLGAVAIAGADPRFGDPGAPTIAFLTLATAQLWQALAMPLGEEGRLANQATRNPWLWAAIALSLALILLGVVFAPLAELLALAMPNAAAWGLIAVAGFLPALANTLRRRTTVI
ncbi:MAG: cation-translocating P-type ATPase [Pseudomonadota bacterium]